MFDQNGHLTDETLIRSIDDETFLAAAEQLREHCEGCAVCRARRAQLEQALSQFADVYSSTITPAMPESNLEHRAALQNRLAAARTAPQTHQARRLTPSRSYLFAAAAIFVIAIVTLSRTGILQRSQSASTQQALRLLPDKTLTPGATHSVDLAEVCSQGEEDLDPAVPDSVKKIVFQEYGMSSAKADDYQVDYLINPQLGGTADVRNLWPEPYGSTVWNARAKDALEDRLHRMVCENQIDLASAQHEIATDWVAAYKKYFPAGNPESAI
jgi:hypothetical protein